MSEYPEQRILSIDMFRGITILTMVFVNELAGISNIPQWLKHMPADANAMTFVDLVFPAFLFIVGMSIPFATQARLKKGDSRWKIFGQGVVRSLSLIIIGFFMVNSIGGYNQAEMPIGIHSWTFFMYISILAVWCTAPRNWSRASVLILRLLGGGGLLVLAWLYKGTDNTWMTPQWWGILGLIGWAYVISLGCYLLTYKNWPVLALLIPGFVFLFWLVESINAEHSLLAILLDENRNHTHVAMVLGGLLLAHLCFAHSIRHRLVWIGGYITISGMAAYLSCFVWPISKIWATPSWALMSIFYCNVIFIVVFWLLEVKKRQSICQYFEPAANNPLLIYILPYILLSALGIFDWSIRPESLSSGMAGVIWSLLFALLMMSLVTALNRIGFRLKI